MGSGTEIGFHATGCNRRACAVSHFWGNLLPAAVSGPAVAICLNSLFAQILGPDRPEMEIRAFASIKRVTWDKLLVSKAEIILK